MEVVGSVAAILQLAQAVGTTILKVSEAYSQIKGIDDILRGFNSQLDATRTVLTILKDGIEKGKFDPSAEGWWQHAELERLLRSCRRHYRKLNEIFAKIARKRSTVPALRAWIRIKQYDSDISHLRLCISTCTDALQLPVIIHKIQTSMHVTSDRSIPGATFVLLDEVALRLTRLESSVEETRNDLRKRAIQPDSDGQTPMAESTTIGKLIDDLERDLSKLASSQGNQASSANNEMESHFVQMQATISQLRNETRRQGTHPNTSLSPEDIRDRTSMEEDTQSMLELVNELVTSTKDYTSTIDTMPTVSKVTSQPSTTLKDNTRASVLPGDAGSYPTRQLLPVQNLKDKLENITEWVNHTNDDDRDSVISRLSGLQSPSSETIVTSTSQPTATTSTENSFRSEMNQRRIRAVEESMKVKDYGKAIDLLEVLFSDDNELLDDQEQDRLTHFMAKAIVEGNRKIDLKFYEGFPLLKARVRAKECRWNLMRATEALDHGDYTEACYRLRRSRFQFENEWYTASLPESDVKAVSKIQLARCQSRFYGRSSWDLAWVISTLEYLLKKASLAKSDKAMAHRMLTRTYRAKYDYSNSKFHGEQAYQIMIDLVGRDDEELHELVQLMVDVCSESEDPDRDVWRKMLPEGLATLSWSAKRPFGGREGLDTCYASQLLRYIHQVVDGEVGRDRLHTGLEYLQYRYSIPGSGSISHNYNMPDATDTCNLETQSSSCERHRALDTGARGFSIIHFFAIAEANVQSNPFYLNSKKKQPSAEIATGAIYLQLKKMFQSGKISYSKDCLDEISILLHDMQRKRDMFWAESKSKSMSTGDFRMHNLVNRPMDVFIPEGSQTFANYVVVTPVWAAALNGKVRTVSFFLSLQETDAVRGSGSIALLENPEKGPTKVQPKPKKSAERPHEETAVEFQNVLQGVMEVFDTLPLKVARHLLSCPSRLDSHWCFVDSSFLGRVLDKCGKESANLPVWSPFWTCPKVQSEYLLAFFLYLVTLGEEGGLSWAGTHDLGSMLHLLLKHSLEPHKDLSSAAQSITILIDHIDDTVQKLKCPDLLKSDQISTVLKNLNNSIELFAIYIEHGCSVSRADIRKVRACIVILDLNREKKSTVSKELRQLKSHRPKHRSHNSSPEFDQFLQTKADLIGEKDNLAALVRTSKRLEKILDKMSV
ncbi:hypothetical protein FIE12Z_12343 [Fusarium flagelliforme]|uniref:Fungal N-terminal domain-containing protein n=1 Tax=Fusarium flagelliforme TaxID=2675880 RepID=A0A395M7Z0_9HYPO|nr:hypothetical protein FIE12Z_12343 [Fusarium flagelliforme]